jgi:predicted translin family RNA/ssDNA-binding protein
MEGAKYVPTSSDGRYNAAFKDIAGELDSFNELRERIVKASRDTTYKSKKSIFGLHRIKDSNRGQTLKQGDADLAEVRALIATRIASELSADLYPQLHRSFSPGMQEYIEAAVFHAYLRDGTLVSRDVLSKELAAACVEADGVGFEMFVEAGDYMLGVADATGELMRLAVGAAGRGDATVCFDVRTFLSSLVSAFEGVRLQGHAGREMNFKMNVMRQSSEKVEATCFNVVMRRAEFGEDVAPAEAAVEAATKRQAHGGGGGECGGGAARNGAAPKRQRVE